MHLRGGRCGDVAGAVDRRRSTACTPIGSVRPTAVRPRRTTLAGYGLGWWVDREDPGHIEDAGAFGAVPWLDLDDGYGVYVVVERTSDVGKRLAAELRPLIDERMGG